MSKYAVIGRHGLLGSALASRLGAVTSYPTKDTRVLFDFGSYTHPTFDTDPEYFMRRALASFVEHLNLCYERGITYVYPSSALIYERDTQFSLFKKSMEHLAKAWRTRSLGLRIFPVYGPGDHGTVISKWSREMLRGQAPVVFGDGTQERDFIYIDDVVDQILLAVGDGKTGTLDIGTGERTPFNRIVDLINEQLGTHIEARHIERPVNYPEGIACPSPLPFKVNIENGIRKVLASLAKESALVG
jgi:nucleoside-diphosphate-sugar epimerase